MIPPENSSIDIKISVLNIRRYLNNMLFNYIVLVFRNICKNLRNFSVKHNPVGNLKNWIN